jgi:hypothetical protein
LRFNLIKDYRQPAAWSIILFDPIRPGCDFAGRAALADGLGCMALSVLSGNAGRPAKWRTRRIRDDSNDQYDRSLGTGSFQMRHCFYAAAGALLLNSGLHANDITRPADAPSSLPPVAGQSMTAAPVLLPTNPDCACEPKTDGGLSGGSTGLRPGLDCLPDACDVCVNRPRVYGSVEYFLQWFENQRVPPLVVIAPSGGLFTPTGVPGQVVLFGGKPVDFGGIDGLRATAGYWLDSQQKWGFEASGFLTEQTALLFSAGHDGAATNPVLLGRTNGGPAVVATVGFPGLLTGGVIASEHTRLWGSEANAVMNWSDRCRSRIDLLAGFRYLDLDESLDIQDFSQSTLYPVISSLTRVDSFDARTQFWGGQFGARTTVAWGRASLALIGKLGLGVSHLSVDRVGQSIVPSGLVTTLPAGVLVTPDNAGRDTTDRFAVLSETTIQVGYQWTKCLQTTIGYNLIYLTSSARVGDQIQRTGGINATDFYSNGITFGLAGRF